LNGSAVLSLQIRNEDWVEGELHSKQLHVRLGRRGDVHHLGKKAYGIVKKLYLTSFYHICEK
jgi:hypothetical protein